MNAPAAAALESPWAMIRTLGVVATLCGVIIVAAYQWTLAPIAANRRIVIERAVFKVIPSAHRIEPFIALPNGTIQPAGEALPQGAIRFYAAYGSGGALAGIAAEGAAKGYADTVRILFGYVPGCACITGIAVVSMRETPGIGTRILTDREFLSNFQALDVRLNRELSGLANAVQTVKHGTKTRPWEIDAIAGATVTSRAVGRAIDAGAQRLLPRLAPHLEELARRP
ncbi:MAG: FMN-binding protein [Betaproteobacteria bacterium CG2_30_68_42]|nr:MAG: FMN-binding protein [Betaproteobacteria bacterium CG2_30_68_42]